MQTVDCIIETPRGSRNKYSYDHERKLFKLGKVLPAGMSFPYDFGYIPETKGADGDSLDVIVLMDEAAFAGCLVRARIIGVFEAEQEEEGKKMRNDRFIAVAETSYTYSDWNDISDMSDKLVEELAKFIVNYQELAEQPYKKPFKIIRRAGAQEAAKLLKK